MKRFSSWAGSLALAVLFSSAGFGARRTMSGDEQESVVSVGGRGTYYDAESADDSNWYGGAQARFGLTRALALEGSVDYRKTSYDGTDIHTYPVQASLLMYLFPESAVSPFLLAGAGWYYTTVDGPGDFEDTDNRFGLHAGGGLQFFLNRWWSLDGAYRYTWVEDIKSQDDALLEKDYEDRGHMITAGLNFHF